MDSVKKSYAVWLGSFAIIATSLYVYFKVSLLPILLGGGLALIATLLFDRFKNRKSN